MLASEDSAGVVSEPTQLTCTQLASDRTRLLAGIRPARWHRTIGPVLAGNGPVLASRPCSPASDPARRPCSPASDPASCFLASDPACWPPTCLLASHVLAGIGHCFKIPMRRCTHLMHKACLHDGVPCLLHRRQLPLHKVADPATNGRPTHPPPTILRAMPPTMLRAMPPTMLRAMRKGDVGKRKFRSLTCWSLPSA